LSESRHGIDAAVQRERRGDSHLDGLSAEHRQRAGHAKQTGQTLVLGITPELAWQRQKLLVWVAS